MLLVVVCPGDTSITCFGFPQKSCVFRYGCPPPHTRCRPRALLRSRAVTFPRPLSQCPHHRGSQFPSVWMPGRLWEQGCLFVLVSRPSIVGVCVCRMFFAGLPARWKPSAPSTEMTLLIHLPALFLLASAALATFCTHMVLRHGACMHDPCTKMFAVLRCRQALRVVALTHSIVSQPSRRIRCHDCDVVMAVSSGAAE